MRKLVEVSNVKMKSYGISKEMGKEDGESNLFQTCKPTGKEIRK
jgi:hypothetical protein